MLKLYHVDEDGAFEKEELIQTDAIQILDVAAALRENGYRDFVLTGNFASRYKLEFKTSSRYAYIDIVREEDEV